MFQLAQFINCMWNFQAKWISVTLQRFISFQMEPIVKVLSESARLESYRSDF